MDELVSLGYLVMQADSVDLARRFNGRFKRLPLHGVSQAVLKDFGSARNFLHRTEPRGLTVRECARLQGFDDGFVFVGTASEQYQLVANAFPPSISRKIAAVVLSSIIADVFDQSITRCEENLKLVGSM